MKFKPDPRKKKSPAIGEKKGLSTGRKTSQHRAGSSSAVKSGGLSSNRISMGTQRPARPFEKEPDPEPQSHAFPRNMPERGTPVMPEEDDEDFVMRTSQNFKQRYRKLNRKNR